MICILTQHKALAKILKKAIIDAGVEARTVDPKSNNVLESLYDPKVTAIIADDSFSSIPRGAAIDMLNAMGKRLPVIVLQEDSKEPKSVTEDTKFFHIFEQITVMPPDSVPDILSSLRAVGAMGDSLNRANYQSIPYFNSQLPISMMQQHGALGILTIDASSFSKIGVEYGPDVYSKVKEIFNDLLFALWGKEGCFRDNDFVCRKSPSSNNYYVFLSRSRGTGSLPLPGALEKVADRISAAIQNSFWNEVFAPRDKRKIPEMVKTVPLVGVGFFGVMNNTCIDPHEILEAGLEASRQVAQAQLRRVKDRQRELMQTLIQSQDLIYPQFQAVFHLQPITREHLRACRASSSIEPIKDFLYGFESLIRVDKAAVDKSLSDNGALDIDPKFLRPDVLFSIAKSSKVALELDQACLKVAASYSRDLPGVLMVNILPRNLYHINRFDSFLAGRKGIIFEVSESEAISNFDLMMFSREALEKKSMGVAADDFGRGYASLERIIKIRPNIIKFDRSIIQDIHEDPVKQAYVKGLVEGGKILKTLILAEGVEKWEELVVLQEMGIELIQGFLLHKPQNVEKILEQVGQVKLGGAA